MDLRPELIDRDYVRNVLVQKLHDHAGIHLTRPLEEESLPCCIGMIVFLRRKYT